MSIARITQELADWEAWYNAEVSKATDQVMAIRADWCGGVYLWYRQGELLASVDRPEGMQLVASGGVPHLLEWRRVRRWIYAACRRVECLPVEFA